ncbi:hypothetical protein O2W14_16675 [Modestobacter sp. VKM Ac-2986]|uniref:hypothetical protein n=1 Tax=Modestobacter sp. VKM Ac-2986 TaxID=3004140 RepID=UPI0022AB9C74|nr:hypothetical protein [Modestobacter sp. VKM Ac-2986]MCZ2830474.1 hypothetical protein [Modestobacter sp. VKM Ac-2986]
MTSPERARLLASELTPGEVDALATQLLLLAGGAPDLAVALVRWARGDRGVQVGPTLATAGLALVTPQLGRWSMHLPGRPGRAVRVALMAAHLLLPLAAGAAPGTVVGTRHPLWQPAVSGAARALGAVRVVRVVLRVARRRRATAVTPG